MLEKLKGKRTYILAALAALTVVTNWVLGPDGAQFPWQEMWQAAVAASLRAAVGEKS